MDLSHATAATATDHDQPEDEEQMRKLKLPIIELLTALPSTLRTLNLSHTSVPPRGLEALPAGLTALDLSHSDVTPASLGALRQLTSLKSLNLASTAVTVSSLQYIPDGVEDMDLSGCTNLIFEKGNLSYKFEFNCMAARWPAALVSLKLAGVTSSPAALFSLPPTVTYLDLSGSSFCIPNVDFTLQLPRLKTLLLEHCKLNYTDEELWALPEGLERLSLKGSSANTRHVRYLPRSLKSLNLADTLLTNYSSLYEKDKVFYFFSTLNIRLPRLETLDVRCGYPYGTHKYAQILREKVPCLLIDDAPHRNTSSSESVPTVSKPAPTSTPSTSSTTTTTSSSTALLSPPSSPGSPTTLNIPRSRSKGLTWKPREQCAKWRHYVERCAEARRNINMQDPVTKEEDDRQDKDDQGQDDDDAALGRAGDRSMVLVLRQQLADGEANTGQVKWIELQYGDNTDGTPV